MVLIHSRASTVIQQTAIRMRTTPYSSLVLIGLLILTSTPPVLGFTFVVTLTGFIYGFPEGVPTVIIGNTLT